MLIPAPARSTAVKTDRRPMSLENSKMFTEFLDQAATAGTRDQEPVNRRKDHMVPATSTSMRKDESATSVRVEIEEVECPTVQARQAIGVFDSGSGGMVAAAH
jgi:hypothetical protein